MFILKPNKAIKPFALAHSDLLVRGLHNEMVNWLLQR